MRASQAVDALFLNHAQAGGELRGDVGLARAPAAEPATARSGPRMVLTRYSVPLPTVAARACDGGVVLCPLDPLILLRARLLDTFSNVCALLLSSAVGGQLIRLSRCASKHLTT